MGFFDPERNKDFRQAWEQLKQELIKEFRLEQILDFLTRLLYRRRDG